MRLPGDGASGFAPERYEAESRRAGEALFERPVAGRVVDEV